MTGSARLRVERVVAACAAGTVWALAAGMTTFAAIPVYAPIREEFGWPPSGLVLAAAASLGVSAAFAARFVSAGRLPSTRALCATGALLSAGILLLLLPNLTHLWQLAGALLLLGFTRGMLALGAWREVSALTGPPIGALTLAMATLVGLALCTPPIAALIYRNSWREGVAAAGGAMLLFASPLAYVLLPGRD